MNRKLITNIATRIRKRRQLVIITFENKEYAFISPNNIKQNTGIEIFELEILIGSYMRIEFYKKGELMFSGSKCTKENSIIKEYYFDLKMPVKKLRIENSSLLLGYKIITKIFYFEKFGTENVGIKTNENTVTFLSLKRFEGQSGLTKSEQHILLGSYILPVFYKKGEALISGSIVNNDNKILKWINLRYTDNIENMHESFENAPVYSDGTGFYDDSKNGPKAYGYDSWEEMTLFEAFEGDPSNYWNIE